MKKTDNTVENMTAVVNNGEAALPPLRKRKWLTLSRKEAMAGWIFVMPALIGFTVFIAFSMIFSLVISFTEWNILSDPVWVGFKNYTHLFKGDIFFWEYLWNTCYYVIFLVPIVLVISLFFAILLNKKVKGMTPFYRACLFVPCVASTVAIAVVWRWLLNADAGVINALLRGIGITNPPKWLLDERFAKDAIIIMRVWQMSGYYMVLFLTGLQTIPDTLYEAARVDGANRWQQLVHITIPMLRPTTFAITILLVLEAFNIFEVVLVMTDGALGTSSLMYYIYQLAFTRYKMGYASALAWVLFLVILGFTVLRFVLKKDDTM